MKDMIGIDSWYGLYGQRRKPTFTMQIRRQDLNLWERRCHEIRRDEVYTSRNGVELRGKDGLGNPYNKCDVDEDIDRRSMRDDHPNVDTEEVLVIGAFLQSTDLLLFALHSQRTIHSYYNTRLVLSTNIQFFALSPP